MRILTFLNHYLPGYKGGGPIRTVESLVSHLGDEFRFLIVTSDRDFGDTEPYAEVPADAWRQVGRAEVYYASPSSFSWGPLARLINDTPHDALYLHSFFSFPFSIKVLLLRRLGLIGDMPVILAPKGEFSQGAMALKAGKKKLFLALGKALGLYRGITWHASTPLEEADIRRYFGSEPRVLIAPDLPAALPPIEVSRPPKEPGKLNMVFLSRVSRKKNLHGALEMLMGLEGDIAFDLYGPLEDAAYWEECQALIAKLPANVRVTHRGMVRPEQVGAVFAAHDIFFMPTMGENFGHVIIEALASGCPVLISDQTPWRDLASRQAGWEFPLSEPEAFRSVLRDLVAMDAGEYERWHRGAEVYGLQYSNDPESVEANRAVFRTVLRAPLIG